MMVVVVVIRMCYVSTDTSMDSLVMLGTCSSLRQRERERERNETRE